MYLDGLPASISTLRALETAFWQRKHSWRDFAVAAALQLFAERDFRSPVFEKAALEWFEIQRTKKPLRHALVGALSQTRQLWLLHGHHDFPQYSAELQRDIGEMSVVRICFHLLCHYIVIGSWVYRQFPVVFCRGSRVYAFVWEVHRFLVSNCSCMYVLRMFSSVSTRGQMHVWFVVVAL